MDTRLAVALLFLSIALVTVFGQRRRDFRIGVDADRRGGTLSGGWRGGGRNWDVGVRGSVDTRGNWGAGVRASIRFKKRSVTASEKHFEVLIQLDACRFDVYDLDGNGYITLDEMKIIMYEDPAAEELFNALDMTTGDGQVNQAEFEYMVPKTIKNCTPK